MDQKIVKWIKIVVLRTLREKNLTRLDVSTLISAGMLGYTQALKRFDPTRNVKFKTFAEYRIKGAVLDEVRKMIGDERCKTPRPRTIYGYDHTMISDNGHTQKSMESQMDIERFMEDVSLTGREIEILRARMDGHTLREISKQFEFSESRASQLLAKIKKTVYLWYKDELGLKFRLINRVCPSCGNDNCVSDITVSFRCDTCDELLRIEAGAPIVALEVHEIETEFEEGYELELRSNIRTAR